MGAQESNKIKINKTCSTFLKPHRSESNPNRSSSSCDSINNQNRINSSELIFGCWRLTNIFRGRKISVTDSGSLVQAENHLRLDAAFAFADCYRCIIHVWQSAMVPQAPEFPTAVDWDVRTGWGDNTPRPLEQDAVRQSECDILT